MTQRTAELSSYRGQLGTGQNNRHRREAPAASSIAGFLGCLAPHLGETGCQQVLPCKPHAKGHSKLSAGAVTHRAGMQSATGGSYHGIRRPKRVQGVLLMKKPTMGSVTASQARPTNRMMEA